MNKVDLRRTRKLFGITAITVTEMIITDDKEDKNKKRILEIREYLARNNIIFI